MTHNLNTYNFDPAFSSLWISPFPISIPAHMLTCDTNYGTHWYRPQQVPKCTSFLKAINQINEREKPLNLQKRKTIAFD